MAHPYPRERDRQTDRQRQTERDRETEGETDKQTKRERERERDTQRDRQTETDRQTDRQADRQTDRHNSLPIVSCKTGEGVQKGQGERAERSVQSVGGFDAGGQTGGDRVATLTWRQHNDLARQARRVV